MRDFFREMSKNLKAFREADWNEFWIPVFAMLFAGGLFFYGTDRSPGGLHWENYDYVFFPGLAAHGATGRPLAEFWRTSGYAGLGLHAWFVATVTTLFGWGWGTACVVKIASLLGVMVVGLTYGVARVCGGRWAGFLAAMFLVSCPAFLTHMRAGNIQTMLNMTFMIATIFFFVLAHEKRRRTWLLAAMGSLAGSYYGAYVALPMLLSALVGCFMLSWGVCRSDLLRPRDYLTAFVVFLLALLLISVAVSLGYFHAEPTMLIRAVEDEGKGIGAALRLLLGPNRSSRVISLASSGISPSDNLLSMAKDLLVGSPQALKFFPPPGGSVADRPLDHLGATLPGIPGLRLFVAALMVVGLYRLSIARRVSSFLMVMILVCGVLILGWILPYQGRRFVVIFPVIAVAAAWGWLGLEVWLEQNIRPLLLRWCRALVLGLLILSAADILCGRLEEHVRTLQFSCYRPTGEWIRTHLDPSRDRLVLLDKSVFFPAAIYAETDFRPYKMMVLSEFYFPCRMEDEASLGRQAWVAPADFNDPPLPRFTCYSNNFFDIDKIPSGEARGVWNHWRQDVFRSFQNILREEMKAGRRLFLIVSHASWRRIESGDPRLTKFLMKECVENRITWKPAALFAGYPTGEVDLVIYEIVGVDPPIESPDKKVL